VIGKKWLLAVGLVSFVGAMAWNAPARLAYDHWLRAIVRPARVGVDHVRGTIASGSADVAFQGYGLGNVNWHVDALSVFTGKLRIDVSVTDPDLQSRGSVAVGFGSDIALRDLRGHMGIDKLRDFFPGQGLMRDLVGTVAWTFKRVDIRDGLPKYAQGELLWQGAGTNAPERLALGDLRVSVTTDTHGVIKGAFGDSGGALKLTGQATLEPDGNYRVNLGLLATGPAQARLEQVLVPLGSKDRYGMRRVTLAGHL
jgi:hypothetical protein